MWRLGGAYTCPYQVLVGNQTADRAKTMVLIVIGWEGFNHMITECLDLTYMPRF